MKLSDDQKEALEEAANLFRNWAIAGTGSPKDRDFYMRRSEFLRSILKQAEAEDKPEPPAPIMFSYVVHPNRGKFEIDVKDTVIGPVRATPLDRGRFSIRGRETTFEGTCHTITIPTDKSIRVTIEEVDDDKSL